MIMISKAEFRRRVAENTEYFQRNYKKSLDISRYHFFDVAAGEQAPLSLMDKVHDIMTAVAVGALPLTGKTGADAVMMIDGELQEIELKFCTINSDRYEVGDQGGIYIAGENSRTALAASIQARWNINSAEHLRTKNRPTVLVVFDKHTNQFVDARMIGGRRTVELLTRGKTAKGRLLNWKNFDEYGNPVKLIVDCMTYRGLKYSIYGMGLLKLAELKNQHGWNIDWRRDVIMEKMKELQAT